MMMLSEVAEMMLSRETNRMSGANQVPIGWCSLWHQKQQSEKWRQLKRFAGI